MWYKHPVTQLFFFKQKGLAKVLYLFHIPVESVMTYHCTMVYVTIPPLYGVAHVTAVIHSLFTEYAYTAQPLLHSR